MIGLTLTVILMIAIEMGRFPVWWSIATAVFILLAAVFGEAIARTWEERNATESEVMFANQFIWATEDMMDVDQLWRDSEQATELLALLSQHSPDRWIADFANRSLNMLSASSAPLP